MKASERPPLPHQTVKVGRSCKPTCTRPHVDCQAESLPEAKQRILLGVLPLHATLSLLLNPTIKGLCSPWADLAGPQGRQRFRTGWRRILRRQPCVRER